jgi:TetR/AcrR family transcriptional regulator
MTIAPAKTEPQSGKERILEIALQRFAEAGFGGTSLADIAADAGMRKPSLLYHFPSKDALRVATLEHLLKQWRDGIPEIMAAASSGENRFDRVLAACLDFFSASPNRARLFLRENLDHPTMVRDVLSRDLGPWLGVIADYIRRGQNEGIIKAGVDPEAYLVQVIALAVLTFSYGDSAPTNLGDEVSNRLRNEFLRLAKHGLFTDAHLASKA